MVAATVKAPNAQLPAILSMAKAYGVKSLDKVLEVQTEFAKSAYETFVAESQKIAGLYSDLAKQTYKPLEGLVAKFNPTAAA